MSRISGDDEGSQKADEPDTKMTNTLGSPLPSYPPPRIINSMVEFDLGPVNSHLQCRLCDGYFRDPITITECLHSFCKSCLYYAFSAGFNKCPTCDVPLGPHPMNATLHDRIKEELLDRVLFPHLREQDEAHERAFYAARNIALKQEYAATTTTTTTTSPPRESNQRRQDQTGKRKRLREEDARAAEEEGTDTVDFIMRPSPEDHRGMEAMPVIHLGRLQTCGRIKIQNVKRFLLQQLNLHEKTNVEILVRGSIVGNELSLTFVERTMWLEHGRPIELEYRYAIDQD